MSFVFMELSINVLAAVLVGALTCPLEAVRPEGTSSAATCYQAPGLLANMAGPLSSLATVANALGPFMPPAKAVLDPGVSNNLCDPDVWHYIRRLCLSGRCRGGRFSWGGVV